MRPRTIRRLVLGAALALLLAGALGWGAFMLYVRGMGAGMPDGAQGTGPSPEYLAEQEAAEAGCLRAARALPGGEAAAVELSYDFQAVEAFRVALWAPSPRPGADPEENGRLVICFARPDGTVLSTEVHAYGAP